MGLDGGKGRGIGERRGGHCTRGRKERASSSPPPPPTSDLCSGFSSY